MILFSSSLQALSEPVARGLEAFRSQEWGAAHGYWQPEAEAGNARAQFYLSFLYGDGLGVEKDEAKALVLLRRSADVGFAPAQFTLGDCYHRGVWVGQDTARAATWWERAARQGYARAQYHLGLLYSLGRGVSPDRERAVAWYSLAALGGSSAAGETLERMAVPPLTREAAEKHLLLTPVETVDQNPDAGRAIPAQPLEEARKEILTPSPEPPTTIPRQDRDTDPPGDRQSPGKESEATERVQAAVTETTVRQLNLPWLQAQPAVNFTVQVGEFTGWEPAAELAERLALDWPVAVVPYRRFGTRWYLVVSGSFGSLSAALAAGRAVRGRDSGPPRVRRFGDLQRFLLTGEGGGIRP